MELGRPLTWSKVRLPKETHDSVFLSCHQNLISNFHVESLGVQTGRHALLLLG